MASAAATNDHIAKIFSDRSEIKLVAFDSRISTSSGYDVSGVNVKVDAYLSSAKWLALKNKFHTFQQNDLFSGSNFYAIEHSVKKILRSVYNFNPDAVAIQITGDESIQFSFRCNKVTYYLEYFPGNLHIGSPEFVLNSYKDKKSVTDSFTGKLNSVVVEINEKISLLNQLESKRLQEALNNQIFSMNFDSTNYNLVMY